MNLSENATRRVVDVVRWYERYGTRLAALLVDKAQTRTPRGLIRNALVTSTITARSGLMKGSGTVSILCDDESGTGTDRVIQTGVKVWNPWRSAIAPNSAGRIVQVETVDGLLQVRGADCP